MDVQVTLRVIRFDGQHLFLLQNRSVILYGAMNHIGKLFDSITVVLGIPVKMSNCRDKNFLLLLHVEKCIGKAFQQASSCSFSCFRPCPRHKQYPLYGGRYFLEKTIPQTRQLMLVVVHSFVQFKRSWSYEPGLQRSYLFLISSHSSA